MTGSRSSLVTPTAPPAARVLHSIDPAEFYDPEDQALKRNAVLRTTTLCRAFCNPEKVSCWATSIVLDRTVIFAFIGCISFFYGYGYVAAHAGTLGL